METTYSFTAPIKQLGNNQSNTGWSITFDWKMPDSQYDFVLGGNKWEDVEQFKVNDVPDVVIQQGSLKRGKEGNKTYDYYWNLVSIARGSGVPTPTPVASSGGHYGSEQVVDGKIQLSLDNRIAWNSAVNNAVHTLGPDQDLMSRKDDIDDLLMHLAEVKLLAMEYFKIITTGLPQQEPAPEWRDPRDGPITQTEDDATGVVFPNDGSPPYVQHRSGGSEMPVDEPGEAQAPIPSPKRERPAPKSSTAKWEQLNEVVNHPESGVAPETLVNYVASNYSERGPRDLVDAEIDEVIDAIFKGNVTPNFSPAPTQSNF